MGEEVMDLPTLAAYLDRDARDLSKLASRGHIPAKKVGGEWRFHRAEIHHWLETQMPGYTDEELLAVERGAQGHHKADPLLSLLLTEATIAVPLNASTRGAVLRELVKVAERSWHIYDSDAVLEAIKAREDLATTALDSGVAVPHPRRPLTQALGESVVAFGRTTTGIPFGAPHGDMTDLFFLVACRDDQTHLQVLARLSRLFLLPHFLDNLRAAETPAETFRLIESAEGELLD